MKIIKETTTSKQNGKTYTNNYYYLVDDKNKFSLPHGHGDTYDQLLNIELGSYDFIFNEMFLFTWSRRGRYIELSPYFAKNSLAFIRDIKIDEIFKD